MTSPAEPIALDRLEEADFGRRRGQGFTIRLPSGEALATQLVETTPNPHVPPRPDRRRGFSIVLRSSLPGHLPQGTYHVEHEEMGTMELFLVPIGPREGGMCYEAVFN